MSIRSFPVPKRKEIMTYLKSLDLKSGDIVFRESDTRGPFGLPFSKIAGKLSNSEYSHASLLYVAGAELYLLEINDAGTVKLRFIDWLDLCVGGRFSIYRYKELTPELEIKLHNKISEYFERDQDYDFDYSNPDQLYCTESTMQIYLECGVEIIKPELIKDIIGKPGKFIAFKIGNGLIKQLTGKGFDLKTPIYFAGNKTQGIMSSDKLECILSQNPYL